MKKYILLFVISVCCGCASFQGQVSKANYFPYPQLSPTGIPSSHGAGQNNPSVTVLGDVIIGKENLGIAKVKRGIFYTKDPEYIYVSNPNASPLVRSNPTGYAVHGDSKLESSVGVSISPGDTPIKIGNVDLTFDIAADSNLIIQNVNHVHLDMSNHDYLTSLINTVADKDDVFFIHQIMVADINDNSTIGVKVKSSGKDVTANLKATISGSYSGVGIIIGAQFAKLESKARVSTIKYNLLDDDSSSCKDFLEKLSRTFGSSINAPYIVSKVSDAPTKNVVVTFDAPFAGEVKRIQYGDQVFDSDKLVLADAVGHIHTVKFLVATSNAAYAIESIFEVTGIDESGVHINHRRSNIVFGSWRAIAPQNAPNTSIIRVEHYYGYYRDWDVNSHPITRKESFTLNVDDTVLTGTSQGDVDGQPRSWRAVGFDSGESRSLSYITMTPKIRSVGSYFLYKRMGAYHGNWTGLSSSKKAAIISCPYILSDSDMTEKEAEQKWPELSGGCEEIQSK